MSSETTSSQSTPAPAFGTPTTSGPKPIAPYQNAVNRLMRVLLRTPLLSLGIGKRLLAFNLVGRKSGKKYVIPVAYTRHEGKLLVGVIAKKWASNIRPGEPVSITLLGRKRLADVVIRRDEASVVQLFDVIARDNHAHAAFSGVGYDADGSPHRADLLQAYEKGAVVIELTVRS
jgi:hypothetical protein